MPEESQKSPGDELSYDIKITNGAAKMLYKLKLELKKDSAKDVVALGLQVLDYALTQGADLVARKPDGEEIKIVFTKDK